MWPFSKSETILDLFLIRKQTNEKNTAKILRTLQGPMSALYEQLKIADIEKQGGTLVWDDVSYVDDGTEPFIILVGVISYPVGAEVLTENGDIVKLTESTVPYFRKLVRAGIPVSMAKKSKEELIAYFDMKKQERADAARREKELEDAMAIDDGPTIQDLLAEQQKKEPEMTFDEFDLTQLTEEQLKKYQMGNKPGKA